MRLDSLELIWIRMPLVGWFATSRGGIAERNILLVRASADGVVGWGESGADWPPRYSYETVATCWHVIEDFFAAEVLGVDLPDEGAARAVAERLAVWAWHPMAKAAIEEAVWDLEARERGVPVHRLYAGVHPVRDRVSVGISLGIQEDFELLAEQIEAALEKGYRRIKLKIEPGRDLEVVRKVRARFDDLPLMVDANCGYRPNQIDTLARLEEYDLLMIEQPFDYDEIDAHAELQARISTPLCLDESAKSVEATARALDRDAARIVNIKCSRLGGRTAGIAVHDLCEKRRIPVWCGGMLESGVGRLHNIATATLPNFRLANDLSASDRYWQQDIVEPAVELNADGTVTVPQGPGIGAQVREDRIEEHLVRRTTLTA